jgi:hypothetical protein
MLPETVGDPRLRRAAKRCAGNGRARPSRTSGTVKSVTIPMAPNRMLFGKPRAVSLDDGGRSRKLAGLDVMRPGPRFPPATRRTLHRRHNAPLGFGAVVDIEPSSRRLCLSGPSSFGGLTLADS